MECFPQHSLKRAAVRELSRDNNGLDDEEETSEFEAGTFKRASDDVLATRKIVRVRRHQTSSTPSAPASNPFAGIHLISPMACGCTAVQAKVDSEKTDSDVIDGKNDLKQETDKAKDDNDKLSKPIVDEAGVEFNGGEKKLDSVSEGSGSELADEKASEGDKIEKKEDKEKRDNEDTEKGEETASLSSFQQLSSSQNAFIGISGTGFSSSTFSFGSITKDASDSGVKNDKPSYPIFSVTENNGNSSLFATTGTTGGFSTMQEVDVETGEENEKAAFTADSVLYEFIGNGWKERGKGELKLNVPTTGPGKARFIMRARGNFRLILNAGLYPDMKLASMDKRGVSFACMNCTGEGKPSISTFALRFKNVSTVEEFRAAVARHKGETAAVLKTPENSPKESDD